jgi:hemoglobin
MTEASLYERLGGSFAIAAVVDHFSDAVVRNPITGQGSKDPKLDEWSTDDLGRLPGLKFMRTLWVCDIAGGPQGYAATKPGSADLGLEEAHRALEISPAKSLPQSSTNSWLSLGDRSTTSTCRRRRKGRYSLPSPPTKAR